MTTRLATMCCAMLLLAAAVLLPAAAQDTATTRRSLQGIDKVSVIVEGLPDSAQRLGLTTDSIQTDVELKLLAAGLHVVPQEEHYNLPGKPYLYINVNLATDGHVASVDVELRQNVHLEREPDVESVVSTWSLGTLMEDATEEHIRDRVKASVDTFLTAWLSANSKK